MADEARVIVTPWLCRLGMCLLVFISDSLEMFTGLTTPVNHGGREDRGRRVFRNLNCLKSIQLVIRLSRLKNKFSLPDHHSFAVCEHLIALINVLEILNIFWVFQTEDKIIVTKTSCLIVTGCDSGWWVLDNKETLATLLRIPPSPENCENTRLSLPPHKTFINIQNVKCFVDV